MGTSTKIAWTDHTWNPWQGCHKVSPGCDHCYMHRDKKRYGQDGEKVVVSSKRTFMMPERLPEKPARVFVCSWSDFFIDDPAVEAARDWAWTLIHEHPHLTFQLLTKRPQNVARMLPDDWGDGYPNVWLGVTAEDQQRADERIPVLLQTPAAVRFVSIEPMLGPIDLGYGEACDHARQRCEDIGCWRALSWVIVGGESGPGARPMHPDWARSLRDQCAAAGVPFFLKQMGSAWERSRQPVPGDLTAKEFPGNERDGF